MTKAGVDQATDGKTVTQAITMYGIRNCDTIKKARSWLDDRGIAFLFHDYRVAGIARSMLEAWSAELGWEKLLNRSGTTFRALGPQDREELDQTKAIGLMLAQPALIKRPVLDLGDRRLIGFKPELYAAAFP